MARFSLSRRTALAIVVLLASAAVPAPTGQEQGQQIVFTFQAVCKGSFHVAGVDDEVSAVLQDRHVYRITKYDNGEGGTDLELISHHPSLSVSGEGKAGPVSWTYRYPGSVAQSSSQWGSLNLSLPGGSVEVHASNPCHAIVSTPEGVGGMAVSATDATEVHSRRKTPDSPSDFERQLTARFKPNSKSIAVSGHGSHSYSDPSWSSGRIDVEYSITGGDSDPDVEVEMVPPPGYEQWQPQAGEDEKSLGNYIDIGIVAHKKGDPNKPPGQKVMKYTITLAGTSREKGVDLNWPQKGTTDFDMKIREDQPRVKLDDKDGQSATTQKEGLTDFKVTVESYDWGGWTRLKVTAELEDHSMVVAHVRGHPDQELLPIPKDDNSNHIADWWEKTSGVKDTSEKADDDGTPPGDGDDGDGVSLYEEYRGLHVQGRHEPLSPDLKDVFLWDCDNLGIGKYVESDFAIHSILGVEKAFEGNAINQKVVNPNRGFGTLGRVYVIEMRRAVLDPGKPGGGGVGETLPFPGVTPKDVQIVRIDVGAITDGFRGQGGPDWRMKAGLELSATIGHELAHASRVRHHGDDVDYSLQPPGNVTCRKADGSIRTLPCTTPDCYGVAVPHGAFSGDTACVMRYNSNDFYEDPTGNCEWTFEGKTVRGRPFGYEPPGSSYCTSPKGSSPAGDAMVGRGECAHHLCVNSRKH